MFQRNMLKYERLLKCARRPEVLLKEIKVSAGEILIQLMGRSTWSSAASSHRITGSAKFLKIHIELEWVDLSDSYCSFNPQAGSLGLPLLKCIGCSNNNTAANSGLWTLGFKPLMVRHGGSSAGSYLADPTSPIPSHCVVIILFKSVPVHQLS